MATKLSTLSLNTDNASKISENTKKNQKFKVLLIGEKKVGKTAIINRFVKNEFISSYKMTVGAIQTNFQCEVPIDLIEEIPEDKNLIRSMTSFLRQVNENEIETMIEEIKSENENDNNENDNDNDKRSSSTIVDYGQWTKPEISQDEVTNTQKTSISLQISVEIIDIGFHSLNNDKIFENINSIILVCDYTKKSSFIECIEKYKIFLKNINIQKQEYIPVIVAINKSDFKKTERELKKKQIKKVIEEKLRPIIDKHFFPKQSSKNTLLTIGQIGKKQRNSFNSTLLQAPNIEFLFDDDVSIDDNDDIDDDEDDGNKDEEKQIKQNIKKEKIPKSDIRYIGVIPCSAKTGKNIEKLFGNCIKKTLPSKLQQSVTSHQRTKTTAHVTAPIWLRNIFDDVGNNSTNQLIAFGDDETALNQVDDNFDFIDDD